MFNQRNVRNLFFCYHWCIFPCKKRCKITQQFLLVHKANKVNGHNSQPVVSIHLAHTACLSLSPPCGRPMVLAEVPCFSRCLAPWNTSPHSLWPDTDFSLSFALLLHRGRCGQCPVRRARGAEWCTDCAKSGFLAGGICRKIQSCKCSSSPGSPSACLEMLHPLIFSVYSVHWQEEPCPSQRSYKIEPSVCKIKHF